MSCEADFTESRSNEQATANLHGVQAACFVAAVRDFTIDYELAQGALEAAIANATRCLEFPSRGQTVAREKVEDLHADVRYAIEAGL
jgi:hypothetical protein